MKEEQMKALLGEVLSKGNIGQLIVENNGTVTYNAAEKKGQEVIVNNEIIQDVKGIFFGKEDVAKGFLHEITGLKPTEVVTIVNRYIKNRQISELSCHRYLWHALHANGYYEPSESNWNKGIKK